MTTVTNESGNSDANEPQPLIVLVIDGLNAAMLGPYGNTTVETPSFNRLAANSIVHDFAVVSSPTLETSCRELWFDLSDAGQSVLVSDDPIVCELGGTAGFERIVSAESLSTETMAGEIADTAAARFFLEAIDTLESLEPGDVCWLHCRGLTGPWDAPYELRQSFADEDDPDPPKFVEPPIASFNPNVDDPDVLLGYQQAAQGQVAMLDDLLGLLLDRIDNNPLLRNAGLVLTSTRGYPLGEHSHVGRWESLYSESLHVPLFVRPPSAEPFVGWRNHWLIQNSEIRNQLMAMSDGSFDPFARHPLPWPLFDTPMVANGEEEGAVAGAGVPEQPGVGAMPDNAAGELLVEPTADLSNVAISKVGGLVSLQTSDWRIIVRDIEGDSPKVQLFSKPDDRHEVNDVSRRCPQVVAELLERLNELEETNGE